MANRFKYPIYWAENGVATDPDLDTTNPSYVPDKYEKQGWISQKPPEQWQNFITQVSDLKIQELIESGIAIYDPTVTYPPNALCRVNIQSEYFAINISGGPLTGSDPTVFNNPDWSSSLGLSGSTYLALITTLFNKYSAHIDASNPHHDTVNTLVDGGYVKADIDKFYGDPLDPQTIVFHKLQKGQTVHKETTAQLNVLPVAGGTFTGDVIFASDVVVQITPSKIMHFNKDTALLEIASGTVALGIDANGNGFVSTTSGQSNIVSESSYTDVECYYNGKSFALPLPIIQAHFVDSLSDADSVGMWTVETASNPVIVPSKGIKFDDNDTNIYIRSIGGPVTLLIRYTNTAGVKKTVTRDFANWTIHNNTQNFKAILSTNFGITDGQYLEDYVVYPQLNAYQKTMLAV